MKPNQFLQFNGARISRFEKSYSISQPLHIEKLSELGSGSSVKDFVSLRAKVLYVSSISRPYLAYGFSKLAQVVNAQVVKPEDGDLRRIKKLFNRAKSTMKYGMRFVPLEMKSAKMVVFSNAGFVTNNYSTIQSVFVITLVDGKHRANIIHYPSTKSRRVTRSLLASDLFACEAAFDNSSTVKLCLDDICGRKLPLILCTDSRCLYDMIVCINKTSENGCL